jgi:hypothetical protein
MKNLFSQLMVMMLRRKCGTGEKMTNIVLIKVLVTPVNNN